MMRKCAHAGKNPADAPGLNHRLVDVGAGVPPLANPHDAPELRKNEQVLWVITERDEFARGGDAAQFSDSLFRSAHRSSLSNRGALVSRRLLSVHVITAMEVVKEVVKEVVNEAPDAFGPRPLLRLLAGTCVPGGLTIIRTMSCRTEIRRRNGQFPGSTRAPAQEIS